MARTFLPAMLAVGLCALRLAVADEPVIAPAVDGAPAVVDPPAVPVVAPVVAPQAAVIAEPSPVASPEQVRETVARAVGYLQTESTPG